MKYLPELPESIDNRYYFVKNKVIYKIGNTDNDDNCAIKLTSGNCPYITVSYNGEQNETKKWLYNLIEVGDTYDNENGFKKTVHNSSEEDEPEQEIALYYLELCEKEMASIISNYKSYQDFHLQAINDFLDFPDFMYRKDDKDGGTHENATVSGVDQILINKEYYNEKMCVEVERLSKEKANEVANQYGYKVNSIEIEKISE